MKFDFGKFYDFGHYGIFNKEDALYPEVREMLEEALKSGEDFDTGWGSFKKEIESIRIQAIDDVILLSVSCSMDDMPELIYDCENSEDLSDHEMDLILDDWDNSDYTTDTEGERELPRNCTVLDIMKAATDICNECNTFLEEGFRFVQYGVNYIREMRTGDESNND